MRCEEFGEVLSEYIEGELSREEAKRVEVHLLKCPACSATLTGVQRVRAALRSLGRQSPPVRRGFALPACLQEEASPGSRRSWSRPMALGLAVVLGMGLVLWPAPQEAGWEGADQDWSQGLDQAWAEDPLDDPVRIDGQDLVAPQTTAFSVSAQIRPASF